MRNLKLDEYARTPGVELTPAECDVLRRVVPSLLVEPSANRPGHYDLTPKSVVGAVTVGDLTVTIRPKVPLDRLLFLLSYAMDPRDWRDSLCTYGAEDTLTEVIIPAFVRQLRKTFRAGLLKGYRPEEDSALTVRGQIRFAAQVGRRFGTAVPVEVAYDDFTEDIEENRLLKAAITRLLRGRIRLDDLRQSLRPFHGPLANVSSVEYHPARLPVVSYNRLNERYAPVLNLATLILRSAVLELHAGALSASGLLVDMSHVFEDFVAVALREALGLPAAAWGRTAAGHNITLDADGVVGLEPDISWWERGRCVFVADAKYKRVNAAGVKHPDLYQMLAYLVALDLPRGLLVYAAGEVVEAKHTVRHLGKELHVQTVNLTGSSEQILVRMREFATLVERLRAGPAG